ncbi:DNA-binding protein [Oleiagrimonas sp. C23AA]|uniref:DNA-binding protein n=1 Tax=Oleiagrimonas sp. C23AA TaxID=2719047 RepID=UPI0019806E3F|nr:DNA-binding protein [Oleiagrimonas sp. C23AA]
MLAIELLQAFEASAEDVVKLLEAARRNLTDAKVEAVSTDTRFDAAYKCIMQCAMLGLWANGYRTVTSKPGHHRTAIQSLPKTMDIPNPTLVVLDGLRKQRNISDYEGDPVTEGALVACVDEAGKLLAHTEQWLRTNNPELLRGR